MTSQDKQRSFLNCTIETGPKLKMLKSKTSHKISEGVIALTMENLNRNEMHCQIEVIRHICNCGRPLDEYTKYTFAGTAPPAGYVSIKLSKIRKK